MKAHVLYCRLTHILRQRNALFTLVALLLMLNFVQAFTTLFKSHRVVVVPPTTTREFWVEGNRVSASYMEEMALFFGSLLLDVSPESAAYKRGLVLRNTVAEGYGALKAKLCEDERLLKKERVVTSFQPNTVKVFSDQINRDLIFISRSQGKRQFNTCSSRSYYC